MRMPSKGDLLNGLEEIYEIAGRVLGYFRDEETEDRDGEGLQDE